MRYLLGDERDRPRLDRAFKGVDVIIHAAALKQVPALEYNPTEAVKTNIMGAMNISQAAVDAGVKKIVALSTDKAAAPINLYGATKLCSDKLFVAAQNMIGSKDVAFSVVRYGNVFGSRGSIVPVLHRLRAGGKAKITDERMSRFNISLNEAVNFVLSAITESRGGEIFVPKLKSYQLGKVFEAVVPECAVTVIGRRPGEKLHELMVPADEAYRTVDIGDRYIIEPDTVDVDSNPTYQRRLNDKSGVKVPAEFGYDSGENTEWCTVEELRAQYRKWCTDYGYEIPAVVAEGATQDSAKKQRTQ
jgi:FlaA1/EpsC-like NDP-sugar epimerase